ncbi:MAG: CYTH domain-containing protein [Parcubacteria group bacterium]|nr:CYTH domain-containing protein [Parcubacteria group bacterium]MCR4342469.1 CYTH domain-containing protein [Patescibacteria group bacterium]
MDKYEIEVKSLLGNESMAQAFREKMVEIDPSVETISRHSQINHYFIDGDINFLHEKMLAHVPQEKHENLRNIIVDGKNHSIRVRLADEDLIFVIKSSIDDTTSDNGISRLEFEHKMPHLSIDELDQILFDAGFSYQAKWSREREEYKLGDINICLDKNAGYGYLVEFESVVSDASEAEEVKDRIYRLMEKMEAEELDQDRLARMFEHYNNNWKDYYGTDKVFSIE